MVRQSRRQVKKRSLRRRTVKGGAYDPNNNGPYIRRKSILGIGSTPLYRLIVLNEDGVYITFELDFSVVTGFGDFVLSAGIDKVKAEYTRILSEMYPGISLDDMGNIKDIIDSLFDSGIQGAKTKKLQIKENKGSAEVVVILINAADSSKIKEITLTRVYPSFKFFLSKLSDGEIKPEEKRPEGESVPKPGLFSRFGLKR